ncbi:hypothetical protein [Flavobacterium subsaxonicum]|uniref:Uncharacterized protein n=1 Tax=Flavobacterium subsaxonicum WB 4.1-42 = DSM 21790 TaxID=1121898 RepID=A0A0A2MQG4_9FLAO|nr:hypothetical protein [Flavobacterium subsaxonicum]KGO94569.1 hypothetical protein Q766_00125 [Flavobacterium subsaxonicum WB 4.1-42 = DSM 21790]
MDTQTLTSLITNKEFDAYKDGLAARCDTEGIDFHYEYANDNSSFTIWMNFGNIPTTIKISTDGLMTFTYFKGGLKKQEQFKNFTAQDFENLNEKAFIYLRDGDLDTNNEWYAKLEKLAE